MPQRLSFSFVFKEIVVVGDALTAETLDFPALDRPRKDHVGDILRVDRCLAERGDPLFFVDDRENERFA
jgi:hypothetical protein